MISIGRTFNGMHLWHKNRLARMRLGNNLVCSASLSWLSETPLLQALFAEEIQIVRPNTTLIPDILDDVVYGNSEFPTAIKNSVLRQPAYKSEDRDTNCPVKTSSLIYANCDETNKNSGEATGNPGNGGVVDLLSKRLRPGPQVADGLYPSDSSTAYSIILNWYIQAVYLLMFAFALGLNSFPFNDCMLVNVLSLFAMNSVILSLLCSLSVALVTL